MVDPIDFNPVQPARPDHRPAAPRQSPKTDFAGILREQQQSQASKGLRFSAHAQQRLESRGLALTPGETARAGQALDQLAAKGAREALLVMERAALVVSVPDRTVITAMPRAEAGEKVFTQIDGAAIIADEPAAQPPEVKDGAGLLPERPPEPLIG